MNKKDNHPAPPKPSPVKKVAEPAVEVQKQAPIQKEPEAVAVPKVEKKKYDYQDIHTAPRNGTLVIVSENETDQGEIALWRKTRAMANATHRWEETGFFVNYITNQPLSFTPKYWRARSLYEI